MVKLYKKSLLRVLSLIVCVVMTVSLTVGCGKKDGDSLVDNKILDANSPVTIKIWHYYNGVQQTKFDSFVKKFNESVGAKNGIIVESVTKNSIEELNSSILSSVNKEPGAEKSPDIITVYADTAYKLDQKNALVDLDKYFSEEELSEFVDSYVQEGRFDGKTLKILPTAKSTEVMILNKTDWDKFAKAEKVSFDDLETWESMIKVAEKYYNYTDALTPTKKNDGKAFFGMDSVANYMTVGLNQLETNLVKVDENGKATYTPDKKAVKKLWENYYVPYVKGYFSSESRYRSDDIKIGKIISYVGSTSGALYNSDEVTINDDYTYPIENVVLKVPCFEGAKSSYVQQGAGMGVIKSNEKNEYASTVFLKWLTSTENNIELSAQTGYLPVKKEANDYQKIKKVMKEKNIKSNKTVDETMKIAVGEINSSELFFENPYKNSSEFRDALDKGMDKTAKEDYKTAYTRIKKGADREKVLEDYTSDKAFETWYRKYEINQKKSL